MERVNQIYPVASSITLQFTGHGGPECTVMLSLWSLTHSFWVTLVFVVYHFKIPKIVSLITIRGAFDDSVKRIILHTGTWITSVYRNMEDVIMGTWKGCSHKTLHQYHNYKWSSVFSVWNKRFDTKAVALSDIARCSRDSREFQTHIAQTVLECSCGTLNRPRYYIGLIYFWNPSNYCSI